MVNTFFEEAFDAGSGTIERTCVCGRVHFNYGEASSFEAGELERLKEKSEAEPDKYIGGYHSIGYMEVPFVGDVVFDCPCGLAEKAENILIGNAKRIASFLNGYAKALRERAEEVMTEDDKFWEDQL
jgi:hypothetical protein